MLFNAHHVRASLPLFSKRIGTRAITAVRRVIDQSLLLLTLAIACAATGSLDANAAEPAQSNWSLGADQELRSSSWSGTRGYPASGSSAPGAGAQFYALSTIQATGQPFENVKVELLGKGGYVWSQQSTPGLTGTVATTTDTVVSGTVTYLGTPGIQPFIAMNANLPTGTTALFGSAANARMDPDIVTSRHSARD